MTKEEFIKARKALGLSRAALSVLLGLRNASTVSRIEAGSLPCAGWHARLMRAYLDGYRPDDWPRPEKEVKKMDLVLECLQALLLDKAKTQSWKTSHKIYWLSSSE